MNPNIEAITIPEAQHKLLFESADRFPSPTAHNSRKLDEVLKPISRAPQGVEAENPEGTQVSEEKSESRRQVTLRLNRSSLSEES
jgi:hypothetical protein